jgi:Spy/CpxP family protein refolding chaperone
MTRASARPWIILALIFLLGAITGALLTIGLGPRFEPGPPGAQQIGNHWMMHLTKRLNLTSDQQDKIRPFVVDAEKQIFAKHHEAIAEISRIMEETNAKIAAQLQPDQQAELKQMEAERERMFQHHLHGNHGPGDFHYGDHDEHHSPPDQPPGAPPDNAPPQPAS